MMGEVVIVLLLLAVFLAHNGFIALCNHMLEKIIKLTYTIIVTTSIFRSFT